MKRTLVTALVSCVVFCIAFACQQKPEMPATPPPAASKPAQSATVRDGVQEVEINVGVDYQPASIALQPDLPVRIHFKRTAEGCGDEVVFPKLGIRKKLPANAVTTVELPPQKSATIDYTCGMNMMKGKVVVQ